MLKHQTQVRMWVKGPSSEASEAEGPAAGTPPAEEVRSQQPASAQHHAQGGAGARLQSHTCHAAPQLARVQVPAPNTAGKHSVKGEP